ncbi:hypothetical protein ABZ829_33610 [Streptomyces xanthochromogenes]|uniref:hypothetical protein n=1 Tax=Streptomyces xanthochromogenes TaxID=67384 RepID=UPI0034142E8D
MDDAHVDTMEAGLGLAKVELMLCAVHEDDPAPVPWSRASAWSKTRPTTCSASWTTDAHSHLARGRGGRPRDVVAAAAAVRGDHVVRAAGCLFGVVHRAEGGHVLRTPFVVIRWAVVRSPPMNKSSEFLPLPNRKPVEAAVADRLTASPFPRWSDLEIRPVDARGWDHCAFRLDEEMLVRLPTAEKYALAVARGHGWLPVLASALSVEWDGPSMHPSR